MSASNDRPTKRFLADYFHDGGWWCVDIYAYDQPDAEIRCRKLGLQFKGEHIVTIPAAVGGNYLARAICWLNNTLRFAR